MELSVENSAVSATAPATRPDATQASIELLCFILGNADSNISVVARELRLSDASLLRVRRAMDWLAWAQSVFETIRAGGTGGTECDETVKCAGVEMRMREAVETLESEWPEDYPAGAVEWLLLQPHRVSRVLENVVQGA